MNISIREILHQYAASRTRTWAHDRSKTVGASEIGQCARKTWFSKHDAPRDPDYVDGWGAALRGTTIEDHYWVPALRSSLPEGWELLFAGDEQQSLKDGYLSATTDGLLNHIATSICINLDCKSIDSRADISKAKAQHTFQVQAQMGLIRDKTKHKPEKSIISYIDASFWDVVTEFVVPFSSRIYAHAHVRATQIMTARDALDLPPEGKMAGGDECKYCAWASHCAEVTVAGVPRDENELDDVEAKMLKGMRDDLIACRNEAAGFEAKVAEKQERIKLFLRDHNTRRHRGDDWSVSYFPVNGKATLDLDAVKAAGVDLEPYYKTGNPGERLRIV